MSRQGGSAPGDSAVEVVNFSGPARLTGEERGPRGATRHSLVPGRINMAQKAAPQGAEQKKPNILVIWGDDIGIST